jgi:hypothetical protein
MVYKQAWSIKNYRYVGDVSTGRTRGLGSAIPWRSGFVEESQTYRSRERAKKRKVQAEATWIESIERKQAELSSRRHWRN